MVEDGGLRQEYDTGGRYGGHISGRYGELVDAYLAEGVVVALSESVGWCVRKLEMVSYNSYDKKEE